MVAGVLRSGLKSQYPLIRCRLHRQSIADSIGSPIPRDSLLHRIHHKQQQSNDYARFPQFIYRKAKELDLSTPNVSSSSHSSSQIGFIGWYLGMVKSRPIVTKSVTSAFIYTAADLSSQIISRPASEAFDPVRTFRMAGYGLLILGPSLHFWFNFVSKILPKRDLITTFQKMFLGQAVYGPTMTVLFFSVNAALQGENRNEIVARLKRDLLPTMLNGVMYWPICDFVTFKFIPVHLQPLVSNSFAYIWTIYMTYMAGLDKVVAE